MQFCYLGKGLGQKKRLDRKKGYLGKRLNFLSLQNILKLICMLFCVSVCGLLLLICRAFFFLLPYRYALQYQQITVTE